MKIAFLVTAFAGVALMTSATTMAGVYSDRLQAEQQARDQQREQQQEAQANAKQNAENSSVKRSNYGILRRIDTISKNRASNIECKTAGAGLKQNTTSYCDDEFSPMSYPYCGSFGSYSVTMGTVETSLQTPAGLPVVFKYVEVTSTRGNRPEYAPKMEYCEFSVGDRACRISANGQTSCLR